MILGDECGLNSLTFFLQLRTIPGNLPDRGSNPGPLDERQRRYPSTTAVVFPPNVTIFKTNFSIKLNSSQNNIRVSMTHLRISTSFWNSETDITTWNFVSLLESKLCIPKQRLMHSIKSNLRYCKDSNSVPR